VVLSHRHSDHVSGFSYLLSVNPKVKIYAPKEGFGIFGSDLPSKFYRKDEALAAEMRYYGGTPPEIMKFGMVYDRMSTPFVLITLSSLSEGPTAR
jgi:7,8-dihydropterin-6-yl-methyl-4-(beta-D-ribofuranosyl)aminobenzene 5'-phosphate synthase